MNSRAICALMKSLTCLCLLIALLATGALLAAEPPPQLHYTFEEVTDGRVVDASGHDHHGTLEGVDGDLPDIVQTDYGPALKLLPGKGHGVRVPYSADLDGQTALTITAWIRPDKARSHLAILANKGDHVKGRPETGYRMSIFWNRAFADLGFGDDEGVRLTTEEWTVNAGHWIHLAMTYDGQTIKLFINAVESASRQLDEPRKLAARKAPFTIGKFFWNDAYPFTGLIGDIRIYNHALGEKAIFRTACEFLQSAQP